MKTLVARRSASLRSDDHGHLSHDETEHFSIGISMGPWSARDCFPVMRVGHENCDRVCTELRTKCGDGEKDVTPFLMSLNLLWVRRP